MPSPVTAAEFSALVPEANATICDVMKLFWQMAVKYAIYDKYKHEESGGKIVLTAQYKTDLCARMRAAGDCGALAKIPITNMPISNTELRALIPKPADPLCLKTQPGMINWMKAVSDRVAWEESPEYLAYLCALPCLGGSNDACPNLVVTVAATPSDSKVTLQVNAAGLYAGSGEWDYDIFRSEVEDTFTNPAIHSGKTTASSFSYEDATAVNDTAYFYKVVVSKAGCGESFDGYSGEVTPAVCISLSSLVFGITPGAVNSKEMLVTASVPGVGIPAGSAYKVYRSTSPGDIGAEIGSGAIGDGSADGLDSGGRTALQFKDTFADAVCGVRYFYTVAIRQDPACTEYQSSAGGLASEFKLQSEDIALVSTRTIPVQGSAIPLLEVIVRSPSILPLALYAGLPPTDGSVSPPDRDWAPVSGGSFVQNPDGSYKVTFTPHPQVFSSGNSTYSRVPIYGANFVIIGYSVMISTTCVVKSPNSGACSMRSPAFPIHIAYQTGP